MLRFMVRRIGTLIITMIVLSIIIFILSEVVPLDPALKILGRESTPEARAALSEQMGFNRPLPERLKTIFEGVAGVIREYQPAEAAAPAATEAAPAA